MTNKLILNYLGDAVIYSSDLALIGCPNSWLNSDLIHFHFLRLQNEPNLVVGSVDVKSGKEDAADSRGEYSNIDCLFLDPTVISFIMHQLDESDEDEVSSLTSAWNLSPPNDADVTQQNIKRIFLPINDEHQSSHMNYTPGQHAGGSHWSLLVIDIITTTSKNNETKPKIQFYSFDSHHGYNISAAKAVANKMYSLFQHHYSSLKKDDAITRVNVIECQALQQNNGYDCGVYTLGFAEALLRLSNDKSGSNNGLLDEKAIEAAFTSYMNDMGGQIHFASNLRRRIGDDIRKLADINSPN
ncbi:C48 family peptidase [Skeletonema marinoi]|uniref:C48 family peptidase n=1 Tax=Skeletonema marinoi TaxID=267567 RepID=A0AAD9DFZ0_9STRA|nr:C48 family peptidase [Skeletonema marinoi]